MLRIALTEEQNDNSNYQMLLSSETTTISEILRKKQIPEETRCVFLNGKQIDKQKYNEPLSSFGIKTTIFITIKIKTNDIPRRTKYKQIACT